ncbi:MAG: mannose-6-phosphate isomerase, class I [Chitinophagaceae bacterium]
MTETVLPLKGIVQHYAWGGNEFIPDLIHLPKEDKPYAEYWMGAHASAPSLVDERKLNELIQHNPIKYIGKDTFERFGELPYLFKVLDVKDMLSIQVHPTKEEAIKGYEKEEQSGIPLSAPHRNYKDKNHKPEIMVALSDFWLLHGFKKEDELKKTLDAVPEFNFLIKVFDKEGYYGLYKTVMELPQDKVDVVLKPLVERALENKTTNKSGPQFWVQKLFAGAKELNQLDRGIFSIYFFNIVHLNIGEGIFQAPGVPHAYLEGQNLELMANSDNVLRGGLTPKYIDVPELLMHIKFEGISPQILKGRKVNEYECVYESPVSDFDISVIKLDAGAACQTSTFSGEIFFVLKGAVVIGEQTFKKGEAFYALPDSQFSIKATVNAVIYRAFVPKRK